MLGKIIDATVLMIVVFLVLTNFKGFTASVGAAGGAYTGIIRAFQGR